MKITLNRPSVYEYNGIVLVAGDNEITDEQAAVLFPSKGIGAKPDVDAGIITTHDEKPKRGRPVSSPDMAEAE